MTRTFTEISLVDLASRHTAAGNPLSSIPLFGLAKVEIPAIAFGDTPASLEARGHGELADQWRSSAYTAGEVRRWRLHSALVHGPFGIITIADEVLSDTLHHIPFHHPGYGRNDGQVAIPTNTMTGETKAGLQVAGGNYCNHYHFLMDVVPKLQIDLLSSDRYDHPVILSPAETDAQALILSLLTQRRYKTVAVGPGEALSVSNLDFIPNMVGHGHAPHPALAIFFANLLAAADPAGSNVKRIYVSRRDSENRVLVNENEIIALVKSYGYEVVELSGLTFIEQMALFHGATHIIAPHGAGLANVIFCQPGAFVCELSMDTYLNWAIRKLAAVARLNYGCIVGRADAASRTLNWPHAMRWSAPLDPLIRLLNQL